MIDTVLIVDDSTTAPTTILLVDDNSIFPAALRPLFDRAGYRLLTASSGEEGLRMAAALRPDAIMVDGILPGIDGATVIRRLRLDAVLRDIPCLLLTSGDDRRAELRALDAGADTLVRKDEDIAVVLAKLAAVLRRTAAWSSSDEEAPGPLVTKKILAVDDDDDYLRQISEALEGEGYDMVLARSGEEAIELLAVQSVDCVLLDVVLGGIGGHGVEALQLWHQHPSSIHLLLTDIVMPEGLSGRDLAARLLAGNPDIRIVFTSGYSADIAGRELSLQEGQNFIQNLSPRSSCCRPSADVSIADWRSYRPRATAIDRRRDEST